MPIRICSLLSNARQFVKQQSLHAKKQEAVPKGHIPVYIGDEAEKKRYLVPLSYLSHPAFQDLLHRAEEEFGFNHPMGGLTIPCTEETFFNLISARIC